MGFKFKGSEHLKELMAILKVKPHKIEVLLNWQKAWDDLKTTSIPLAYLDYIGAEKSLIKEEARKDMLEFEHIKELQLSPKTYTIRLMPAIYSGGEFPDGLTEKEAASWLFDKLSQKGMVREFFINYPELKTSYFKPDGSSYTQWYVPRIEFTEDFLLTGHSGENLGKCCLT